MWFWFRLTCESAHMILRLKSETGEACSHDWHMNDMQSSAQTPCVTRHLCYVIEQETWQIRLNTLWPHCIPLVWYDNTLFHCAVKGGRTLHLQRLSCQGHLSYHTCDQISSYKYWMFGMCLIFLCISLKRRCGMACLMYCNCWWWALRQLWLHMDHSCNGRCDCRQGYDCSCDCNCSNCTLE